MTNPLEQIRELAPYLRNYKQCDEDGVMCSVSRQAIETLLAILDASQDYVCVPVDASKDMTRMDWLVSHDVEVRDPRLHGSSHLFTAQTTSDEEDEIYQTSLREQIDAAMLAASKETNRE